MPTRLNVVLARKLLTKVKREVLKFLPNLKWQECTKILLGTIMHNLKLIEEFYQKIRNNMKDLLPEGILSIDLELLHKYNLLHFEPISLNPSSLNNMTQYFHVIESQDKITLVNDEFIVWIMPEFVQESKTTYALIALNRQEKEPQLQLGFSATGVYNTSHIVLKVLESYLAEIRETEKLIQRYEDAG